MAELLNIPPTRSELLALNSKIKLANKGYNLLKRKRDALMKQFMALVGDYKRIKQEINIMVKEAYHHLSLAQALSGQFRVKSIALATDSKLGIKYSTKNAMGVKLQELELTDLESQDAKHVGPSVVLRHAQLMFTRVLKSVLKLAELEQNLMILSEEIIKTKRRVNSLEHIHIPRMNATSKFIKFRLGELERESFSMLKSIKSKMEE